MPSPQQRKVERDHPTAFTTLEVAEIIGRSKTTIERWRREGLLVPQRSVMSGDTRIWLYDKSDLAKAVALAKIIKPGRKKIVRLPTATN